MTSVEPVWLSGRYVAVCRDNPDGVTLVEQELEALAATSRHGIPVAEIAARLGGRAGSFDFVAAVLAALSDCGAVRENGSRRYDIELTRLAEGSSSRLAIRRTVAELRAQWMREMPSLLLAAPALGLTQVDSRVPQRFQDLRTAVRSLIASAEHTLVLASPFWDPEVAADLATLIGRRLSAGVEVRIITRQPRSESDANALRSLSQAASGRTPQLRVLETASELDRFGSATFHFKAAVADGSVAYIGSANFNVAGLLSRWELGTLLRGEMAHQVGDLLESLYAAASPLTPP